MKATEFLKLMKEGHNFGQQKNDDQETQKERELIEAEVSRVIEEHPIRNPRIRRG